LGCQGRIGSELYPLIGQVRRRCSRKRGQAGRWPRVERDATWRRAHEHSLWDRKLTEKDLPSIDRRISEFEKTLTALRPLEYKRWQLTVENVGHDKMTDPNFGHEIDRFRLRLIFKNQSFTADTVVTAYCNRNVTVFDWYQIPGEDCLLIHATYTGDPFETCYETDMPILVLKR